MDNSIFLKWKVDVWYKVLKVLGIDEGFWLFRWMGVREGM